MSKCRVLQIVASSRGGGAELIRCLVNELDPTRYESTVVMPDDGGQLSAADFEAIGARCLPFDIAAGFSLSEWWRLRRFVRSGRFDVVHCHGARAALWVRLAAVGPRRPKIVFGVHGLSIVHYRGLKRVLLLGIERLLQVVTDITLCDSDSERADVIRYGIAPPEHTHTIHNGIDLNRLDRGSYERAAARAALGLDFAQPTLVTVCRLNKPRDFDTLLRAMQAVVAQFPTVRLLIVGDGPLRPAIEDQIQTLALGDNVWLLGIVRDVGQALAAADVFVLSTQGWEGLPLAPLEAMVMRLPVVISDVGGNREAVQDGVTGLVVPPRQPQALADALLRLLQDHPTAQQMGQHGYDRVVREFSAQRMARETMAIYARLNSTC
ncbi:MAG: glycosyltransferase [Anaerolineales bacterium]|nr:glycosyltransferase [Anaerolineales bacterium]